MAEVFCPFDVGEEFRWLREHAPVSRIDLPSGAQAWFVTRQADARQVLTDGRFRSVDAARLMRPGTTDAGVAEPGPGVLLFMDPPEHTRLRRMLAGNFTVRRMDQFRPVVESIVTAQLDEMARRGGPVDFVREFALPVPSLVICELLGVPYADRAEFRRRTAAQVDLAMSEERAAALWAESTEYMARLVADKRAHPTDDLLGRLVAEHGHELSDAELSGIGIFLLGAGYETTANMLALGLLLLLRHPDQLARLRDAAVVDRAVEELLRYLTVVNNAAMRQAREDVEIGGQLVGAGEFVLVSLGSSNRDDAVYDRSDEFDIDRSPAPHLAFGHGVHHCLGAPLARLELQVAYPALLARFPDLRLAVPFEDLEYLPRTLVHGVRKLPVTW
ncbi:cytochrome P450 [Saccharopolyspora subtropica]|uniref:Cytochrome P450 n=1 Tax=Saccharopolyspora thermophila TaxID=89367 RepID=A0A917NC74_9PSEU|nr:cytochrome P450 [Saccharopolyspora subtropica]GGI87741.1 cytochrome P450 [Saccharopolyspora subtropica]